MSSYSRVSSSSTSWCHGLVTRMWQFFSSDLFHKLNVFNDRFTVRTRTLEKASLRPFLWLPPRVFCGTLDFTPRSTSSPPATSSLCTLATSVLVHGGAGFTIVPVPSCGGNVESAAPLSTSTWTLVELSITFKQMQGQARVFAEEVPDDTSCPGLSSPCQSS